MKAGSSVHCLLHAAYSTHAHICHQHVMLITLHSTDLCSSYLTYLHPLALATFPLGLPEQMGPRTTLTPQTLDSKSVKQ